MSKLKVYGTKESNRYEKQILIEGGPWRVWVDNDDVPDGAFEFATALAKAFNAKHDPDDFVIEPEGA